MAANRETWLEVLECLECGKEWRVARLPDDPQCPRCNGVDVDLAGLELARPKRKRGDAPKRAELNWI